MVNTSAVSQEALKELANQGYQGRVVSVQHLTELEEGIESHRREGKFDEEFDRTRLSFFRYGSPETISKPQSLIIVAVPRPQTSAVFTWRGESVLLIIPPTYTDYRKIAQRVVDLLTETLEPFDCQVALSLVPLKSLAARSGLATYGRNNICYVSGMGSFLELVGLYSNLPCHDDTWQEARMMEACRNCRACMNNCPTGAITEERFLLRGERCLSFHNEQPGNIPFPSWINPSWHNCIEGCMLCQRVCPEDKKFWSWIEGTEEFSEEETTLLLQGGPRDRLAKETIDKLERLDILDDLELLPRNLGVFLRA